MSRIRATGLQLTYPGRPPVPALREVDLDVDDGTLLAVLGPSGCGKTSLLRCLAGMERPDAGEIHVGDRLVDGAGTHLPPERRAVGLVPQEGALFPHLDVAANIAFGLRGRPRPDRRARVTALLDLVGLAGMGGRRPHELSGGQQQRVALARALAPEPGVVLLDEPFSALDTGLRAELRDEVAGTLRAAGTTAVLVTHDQTEAMTMADALAVMHDGRIVQVGPPAEVYRRPVDEWTARFLGDAVVLPGRRRADGAVTSALGPLRLADGYPHHEGPDVAVFCRPEQVRRAEPGGGTTATVTSLRFLGPDALLGLAIGDLALVARWPSGDLPSVGTTTEVVVAGEVLAFAPPPPPVDTPD